MHFTKQVLLIKICRKGLVAQLVERIHGMDEAVGSIPIKSTKCKKSLAVPELFDLVEAGAGTNSTGLVVRQGSEIFVLSKTKIFLTTKCK